MPNPFLRQLPRLPELRTVTKIGGGAGLRERRVLVVAVDELFHLDTPLPQVGILFLEEAQFLAVVLHLFFELGDHGLQFLRLLLLLIHFDLIPQHHRLIVLHLVLIAHLHPRVLLEQLVIAHLQLVYLLLQAIDLLLPILLHSLDLFCVLRRHALYLRFLILLLLVHLALIGGLEPAYFFFTIFLQSPVLNLVLFVKNLRLIKFLTASFEFELQLLIPIL